MNFQYNVDHFDGLHPSLTDFALSGLSALSLDFKNSLKPSRGTSTSENSIPPCEPTNHISYVVYRLLYVKGTARPIENLRYLSTLIDIAYPMIHLHLTEQTLHPQTCIDLAAHPGAGGSTVFIGTVRDQTKGKAVIRLEFEAYAPMALSEMRKIAEEAEKRWQAHHVVIYHRVGILEIGDIAVIIAVSTPHRAAAFEACQYCIDTLKETVPIWKKEVFADGEIWVAAHP